MESIKEIIRDKNNKLFPILGKTLYVTKVIGYLHKEFDTELTAQKSYEKGYNDPNSKYYHMSVDAILDSWNKKGEDSRRYGSLLDDYSGMRFNNEDTEEWKIDNNYDYDERLRNLCNGFDQFYSVITSKTDYQFVARELTMLIKSNKTDEWINGRFDWLFYSPSTNKYIVFDCKSSGSIDSENRFEKMLGPLYDKDSCNLNHYTIQIQMYKKALSETYQIASPENIDVYICQITDHQNDAGTHFRLYRQGFEYDSGLLDDIIEFGYKKHLIKNKDQ